MPRKILIAIHCGEGYEDIHQDLVAEDFAREAIACGWRYDVIGEKGRDGVCVIDNAPISDCVLDHDSNYAGRQDCGYAMHHEEITRREECPH